MTIDLDETARQTRAYASERIRGAGDVLHENPMATLFGGLALGVLIGALLPRTEREVALLGPLGARIGDAAHDAIEAARATSEGKLDELGLTREAAFDKVKTIIDGALDAATAAGEAAKSSLHGGD